MFSFTFSGVLERDYILCLRTFLAISDSELDFLAIGQGFEAVALDGAKMDKDIRAILALNKAETLGLVKPFNCACCCRHILYLYYLRVPCLGTSSFNNYLWLTYR